MMRYFLIICHYSVKLSGIDIHIPNMPLPLQTNTNSEHSSMSIIEQHTCLAWLKEYSSTCCNYTKFFSHSNTFSHAYACTGQVFGLFWMIRLFFSLEKSCSRPAVASGISISPLKEDYNIGEGIYLSCAPGFRISGTRSYRCAQHLDWEPEVHSQITCEKGNINLLL